MSWGEVFKINNNMKKAINEQLRDLKFQEIKIITSTGTYTPTKTGLYKVICIGAGGNGFARFSGTDSSSINGAASGGGGGVAISTLALSSSGSYAVTVSSTASFVYSNEITLTATAGGAGAYNYQDNRILGGTGGTASGGDNNYLGTDGDKTSYGNEIPKAGGVSVYISELSYTPSPAIKELYSTIYVLDYGTCLLGYGGGGTGVCAMVSGNYQELYTSGKPAAIIIVPLELEE